jgi:hypothetical protein
MPLIFYLIFTFIPGQIWYIYILILNVFVLKNDFLAI